MAETQDRDPPLSGLVAWALALIALLFGGLGAWATYAPLSGAVIASGSVVVDSNVKKVQHPTGGIVGSINARNGDHVTAGDVLLRLDDTQTRANLGVILSQLIQLKGRRIRLEAERDGSQTLKFPAEFESGEAEAADVVRGEKKLFDARQILKNGQRAQLKERVGQLRRETEGLTAQRDAKSIEIELMQEELARLSDLRRQNLIPQPRVLAAQRDLVKLKGEWGALEAQIARSLGSISETELQIMTLDQTMQTEASKELRDVEGRIAELLERRVSAEDQLRRISIYAPQTGVVHELTVHTVGGVIGAAETIMLIVPDEDRLAIEVRVAPIDIDQIAIDQKCTLRFSAFNQRATPEFACVVSRVGADITRDPQTNTFYYLVRLRIADSESDKLNNLNLKLVPGMPVEAFIETGQRTMMSYLTKPLMDQIARAFKEE